MKNTAYQYGITENSYINTYEINLQKLFSQKICAIKVKCSCEETSFDIIINHNADFGRVYDRFAKKCDICGEDIRVEFNFL
jgi:hypothetical protein